MVRSKEYKTGKSGKHFTFLSLQAKRKLKARRKPKINNSKWIGNSIEEKQAFSKRGMPSYLNIDHASKVLQTYYLMISLRTIFIP